VNIFAEIHERYGDPALFLRNLAFRMKEHEISQGALARRAGYHPSHVNHWLRGRKAPTMHSMVLLDEALTELIEEATL
jgi:transcriptional regulator with XRE-family HTH domain